MERRISRGTRMMGWREEEFFVSMVFFFTFGYGREKGELDSDRGVQMVD